MVNLFWLISDALNFLFIKVAEVLLRHGAEPMLNDGEDTAAAAILQEVMEENVMKNKRENLPGLNIFSHILVFMFCETSCLKYGKFLPHFPRSFDIHR